MERYEQIRPPQSDPERLNLPSDTPLIYVTSVADFADNVRHSAWIRADRSVDEVREQIAELLAASPDRKSAEPGVPGWSIEDSRGFYDLGRHLSADLDEITDVGHGIVLYGEAFAAFAMAHPGPKVLEEFEDSYQAMYINAEVCIDAFLDDMGWQRAFDDFITEQGIEGLVSFDRQAIWDSYTRSYEVLETREGVIYVFSQ